ILPVEQPLALERELVVERLGIVVVDQSERLAGSQRVKGLENQRLALARGDSAHVDRFDGLILLHEKSPLTSWINGASTLEQARKAMRSLRRGRFDAHRADARPDLHPEADDARQLQRADHLAPPGGKPE